MKYMPQKTATNRFESETTDLSTERLIDEQEEREPYRYLGFLHTKAGLLFYIIYTIRLYVLDAYVASDHYAIHQFPFIIP